MKKYLYIVLFFFKKYRSVVVVLLFVAIITDILFVGFKSDLIAFTILGLYLAFSKLYRLSSKRTFAFCFVYIGIIFFGFLIDPSSLAIEKAAIWLFLLIGAGILQEFVVKEGK